MKFKGITKIIDEEVSIFSQINKLVMKAVICISLMAIGTIFAAEPLDQQVSASDTILHVLSAPTPISNRFHAQDRYGQYFYGYNIQDRQYKTEARSSDGIVMGKYGYNDPYHGTNIYVHYTVSNDKLQETDQHNPHYSTIVHKMSSEPQDKDIHLHAVQPNAFSASDKNNKIYGGLLAYSDITNADATNVEDKSKLLDYGITEGFALDLPMANYKMPTINEQDNSAATKTAIPVDYYDPRDRQGRPFDYDSTGALTESEPEAANNAAKLPLRNIIKFPDSSSILHFNTGLSPQHNDASQVKINSPISLPQYELPPTLDTPEYSHVPSETKQEPNNWSSELKYNIENNPSLADNHAYKTESGYIPASMDSLYRSNPTEAIHIVLTPIYSVPPAKDTSQNDGHHISGIGISVVPARPLQRLVKLAYPSSDISLSSTPISQDNIPDIASLYDTKEVPVPLVSTSAFAQECQGLYCKGSISEQNTELKPTADIHGESTSQASTMNKNLY